MNGNRKLIFGVGINDADYVVKQTSYKSGKYEVIWQCPYYMRWIGVLERCFSEKAHVKIPSYKKCTIADEWVYFTNFKKWMETQDWHGKEIDKDILIKGNKIYSPKRCCFVEKSINIFVADKRAHGLCMTGVTFNKGKRKFESRCNNPFTKKTEYLGAFDDELDAHNAWKIKKHHFSCLLAETVSDERVAKALRVRYA